MLFLLATSAVTISRVLQDATTPVILISGVGILLLVLNNRLTHLIDRIRGLSEAEKRKHPQELRILISRAKILRLSIGSLCVSIFSSSLLTLCSVLQVLSLGNHDVISAVLLIVSVGSIAVAAGTLLSDVIRSLHALQKHLALEAEEN